MKQEDFKKLQITQMEILDEIHRICVKHNLIYYIIGGTALGALRHGGFIPWDFDMDIAMPRKDYDELKKVCENELEKRFVYRDYTNTRSFTHPHALVCIKNTSLRTKSDKYNNDEDLGIYLDIFPLDNAPDDLEQQRIQAEAIRRIKRNKYVKMAHLYDSSIIKKILKTIRKLPLFYISIDRLNLQFDKEMHRYDNVDTKFLCSMASHYSYERQCMPKEVYGTPQLVKFENRMYFAPEQLDEYLKRIYKDYMKLPPENERQFNLEYFETVVFDK